MTDGPVLKPGAVCLVTGASRGIGRAIADCLLDRGLRVIAAARGREGLDSAFAGRGEDVLKVPLDVTDSAAVTGFLQNLPEEWRDIDVLIANAGSDVGGRQHFEAGSIEDWVSTIDTNVSGLMRICHAILPGMSARGHGHLVTLGSDVGNKTYAGGSAYASSKHAVRAFTDCLRHDYKTSPIRITEIMPALVRTGFAEARHRGDSGKAQAFYDSAPAALAPEDIAATVMFALEQPAHVNIAQVLVTPTGDK